MLNWGVTPVDPSVLLKTLETQLQESGTPSDPDHPGAGLGDRAYLSLFKDQLHLLNPTAMQFVTIRPVNFPLWQGLVSGGGRELTGFDGIVQLTAFIQMSADPEMKNVNAISEEVLSVTSLVLKVLSAVQLWAPKDTDSNEMLREPARVPDDGFSFEPVDGTNGPWVLARMRLQLRFTCLLP